MSHHVDPAANSPELSAGAPPKLAADSEDEGMEVAALLEGGRRVNVAVAAVVASAGVNAACTPDGHSHVHATPASPHSGAPAGATPGTAAVGTAHSAAAIAAQAAAAHQAHAAAAAAAAAHAAAVAAVPQLTKEDFEAEARAVLKAEGEQGVQARLKAAIAASKSVETQLASVAKKRDAATRERDRENAELSKLLNAHDAINKQASALLKENQTFEATLAAMARDDPARREAVKENFLAEVKKLRDKLASQVEQQATVEAENVELKKEFDALKAEFDARFNAALLEFKSKEGETATLVTVMQTKLIDSDRLRTMYTTRQEEINTLRSAIAKGRTQLDLYKQRFTHLEEVVSKSADVLELSNAQKARMAERIAAAEEERKRVLDVIKQAEVLTNGVRQQTRDNKKKILLLERQKAQLEARCRDLHRKAAAAKK